MNKQQYHAKSCERQGYIVGHLSLTRNLALDLPSEVATVRDLKLLEKWCSQKKRFKCF